MGKARSNDPVSRAILESLEERWKRFRKKLRGLRKEVTVDRVHDERTACRRLLSTLGVVAPLVGRKRSKELERNLKDVLGALGPVRDLHVELDHSKDLQNGSGQSGFQAHLRRRLNSLEKRAGRRAFQVNDKRLGKAVRRIGKRLNGRVTPKRRRRLLEPLDAMFAEVLEERRLLDPTDVATLHRVRVALKNFRYGVEALEPVLQGFDRKHLDQLHDLQDTLGELHDLEVLSASLRKFVKKRGSRGGSQLAPIQKEIVERHNKALREAMTSLDRILGYWKGWAAKRAHRLRRAV